MNRTPVWLLSLALITVLANTSAHAAPAPVPDKKTIVEIAAGDKDLSKLVAAVKAAGLVELLSAEGPFTVFAPTDKAFEALGEETLKQLLADNEKLKAILSYHVVKGTVVAEEALVLAKYDKAITTLNGAEIKLSVKDKKLTLNGNTTVIQPDGFASNGVVHVIDKVLLPPAGKVAEAKEGKAGKLCVPANEATAYAQALKFTATQEEKKRLVELFRAAGEQTPPRGNKDAWKKRNEGLIESAKEFAAEMEPKNVAAARIKFSLAVNCIGCHLEHKENGVPRFTDPKLGRIPDDIPAEFKKMPPQAVFPQVEFPKVEFPKVEFPMGNFALPNPNVPRVGQASEQEKAFGAALRSPDAVLTEQLELPRGQGLLLGKVQPKSAAAKAGLKEYDILLELNGKPVSSNLDEFTRQVKDLPPNMVVNVLVLRKGKKETVKGLMLPDARPVPDR